MNLCEKIGQHTPCWVLPRPCLKRGNKGDVKRSVVRQSAISKPLDHVHLLPPTTTSLKLPWLQQIQRVLCQIGGTWARGIRTPTLR